MDEKKNKGVQNSRIFRSSHGGSSPRSQESDSRDSALVSFYLSVFAASRDLSALSYLSFLSLVVFLPEAIKILSLRRGLDRVSTNRRANHIIFCSLDTVNVGSD